MNVNKEDIAHVLPMMAMDSVSDAGSDALRITGLVKSGGSVTGYQLSDGRIVSRESGVELAKENQIQGVGVAHNKDTEYLKSIPDGTQDNNLSHYGVIPIKGVTPFSLLFKRIFSHFSVLLLPLYQ